MMDNLEIGGPDKLKMVKSLFTQQSVRGWWPCSIKDDGKKVLEEATALLSGHSKLGTWKMLKVTKHHYPSWSPVT
ncbi:hypothetical protein CHARACLAT_006016 [Characodon lateralis]|uniref:Uncharacterized protein n=1 Tax=Characodon lateralis TaxID=208331 RepID=A0ABU7ETV9_9TELE|nr:hypothetical protein [Characodon lateralis]